jgi:hypothetical protein
VSYGAAGGGNGGFSNNPGIGPAVTGLANTGGGGGGGAGLSVTATQPAAAGGSGVVIIRYPSYQVAAASTTGGPDTYVVNGWRVYAFVQSGTITF